MHRIAISLVCILCALFVLANVRAHTEGYRGSLYTTGGALSLSDVTHLQVQPLVIDQGVSIPR
jgi:hypothetical protein